MNTPTQSEGKTPITNQAQRLLAHVAFDYRKDILSPEQADDEMYRVLQPVRQLETELATLTASHERMETALGEIVRSANDNTEFNPVSEVFRLPMGYQKIIEIARQALARNLNQAAK